MQSVHVGARPSVAVVAHAHADPAPTHYPLHHTAVLVAPGPRVDAKPTPSPSLVPHVATAHTTPLAAVTAAAAPPHAVLDHAQPPSAPSQASSVTSAYMSHPSSVASLSSPQSPHGRARSASQSSAPLPLVRTLGNTSSTSRRSGASTASSAAAAAAPGHAELPPHAADDDATAVSETAAAYGGGAPRPSGERHVTHAAQHGDGSPLHDPEGACGTPPQQRLTVGSSPPCRPQHLERPLWLSAALVPICLFSVSMALFLGLILLWAVRDHAEQYRSDSSTIITLSAIGAQHQAYFITLGTLTAILFVASLILDYKLRRQARLPPGRRKKRETIMARLSIAFGVVAAIGLIGLTIANVNESTGTHYAFAGVFFVCLVLSGAANASEITAISHDYPRLRAARISKYMKLLVVLLGVAFLVCFVALATVCDNDSTFGNRCNAQDSAAAVFEYLLAFVFVLFTLTLVVDLLPERRKGGYDTWAARFSQMTPAQRFRERTGLSTMTLVPAPAPDAPEMALTRPHADNRPPSPEIDPELGAVPTPPPPLAAATALAAHRDVEAAHAGHAGAPLAPPPHLATTASPARPTAR
ncbi:hypothetical protein CXG81DRAFT_19785 [Caulochytrium protostelioides]|uniref:CWH43-like N-terminal domain-containing protein n=1 Tax=Caulochytrium protostelioides TaxID=1555241 RepID=A0A4P9X534_9FUNG|nr:hypothetical protein CXG81DRAFT_19785 [Caulochytrium protostelioides]|eukprot:RKP00228.1 hypothetical protein CXG81DRAFT_19785 [Caulochytrium protostelioides]